MKNTTYVKHFRANIAIVSVFLLIFAPVMGHSAGITAEICAQMVESVDTRDLKSLGHCGRTGSSPVPGTIADSTDYAEIRPATYTTMSWDDFVQAQAYDGSNMSEEEWAHYMEQLEWLHSHPMDINTATPEEMAALPFLTPAQIEAIQAYTHLDGPMKSLGELALIPALDYQTRQVLPLFFCVSNVRRQTKKGSWLSYAKHSVDTRMDIPLYYRKGYQTGAYKGNTLYHRMRYTMESDHLSWGAKIKKDQGEDFADSYGAYVMIRDCGILRSAIAGDYRAGWGEGLVIGRGSFYGKGNLMSSSSSGLRPMTGMMESGFLRGVAVTLGHPVQGGLEDRRHFSVSGSLFASYQAVDATLDEDGGVRTLITSGYHRTKSEREKKNNTHTALVGAHLQFNIGKWNVGATGYWQHFDRILSPGDDRYRRWYPRGTDFAVMGMHAGYSAYRWTCSAEVAYSTNHGGVAALGRVQWLVNRNLRLGALGRYYDHRYYSFQSSAMAENSRVQNERGAMIRMEARPWGRVFLIAYADFFSDYWPRYGMTKSSSGQEIMTEAQVDASSSHKFSFRYQMKRKAMRDVISPRHRVRAQWTCTPSQYWRLQSTATAHFSQGHDSGYGFGQLVQGNMLRNKSLRMSVMGSYFYAPDYQTRVYIYEPSLWNSTAGSYSLYGHGVRAVATLRYTFPRSHWMVEAKYAITHMLDRETMGSGNQEILSPTRQDLSVQLRMTY